MVFNGFVECCDDDRCGDSGVCRDGEGVAGVVIEPGQDFLVGAIGETDVGHVCLPGVVREVGFEPGERGLWAFPGVRVMSLAVVR